ncbi:MAG: NAD-dependent epimerase/dehydratase family protein [Cytophagaceae bacterium]
MFFITGCNGLVGSYIARDLLQKGEKVRALKRKDCDLSLLRDIQEQIDWIEGDISDVSLLDEALKGIDYVIHSAAVISFAPKDKELMFRINVEGTANIVNASLKNSIKNFCHVSSVAALGEKKDSKNIDETSEFILANASNYGYSKYLSELEVYRGIEEGLNAFIVNPSIILGPGNWEKSSSRLFKYVWEENLFFTEGKMNFIDIRDVTSIIIQLMNLTDIKGERFILNAGSVSYKDFFNTVAYHLDVRPPKYKINTFIAEVAWRLEAIKSKITGSSPLITKETARNSRKEVLFNNLKIRETLGVGFRTIEDTINWSCQELKGKYARR